MKIQKRPLVNRAPAQASNFPHESEFREVVDLIRGVRRRALQAVNTSLVSLYWEVGRYISQKLREAVWGEGVVDQLARYISRRHSDLRGFERRNLFRMRQFYDAYKDHRAAAPLIPTLSWSSNLLILSRCKSPQEREFYLRLAHREGWDKRETDRQLRGALFERAILARPKVSPAVTQLHPDAEAIFKDSYLVDFLNLPEGHSEQELQVAIIMNLKRFLLELGSTWAVLMFAQDRHLVGSLVVRFTDQKAVSCIAGDWRRLEVLRRQFNDPDGFLATKPLSYIFERGELTFGVTEVCDGYVLLRGVPTEAGLTGDYGTLGLDGFQKLGSFAAALIKE